MPMPRIAYKLETPEPVPNQSQLSKTPWHNWTMPPTPTRARRVLTAKQKATQNILMSAAGLVICVSLCKFMAPLSKGNFVQRELAFCWCVFTIMLIPINLFTFVVFVYHFHGASIRCQLISLTLSWFDLLTCFGISCAESACCVFDSAYLVWHWCLKCCLVSFGLCNENVVWLKLLFLF